MRTIVRCVIVSKPAYKDNNSRTHTQNCHVLLDEGYSIDTRKHAVGQLRQSKSPTNDFWLAPTHDSFGRQKMVYMTELFGPIVYITSHPYTIGQIGLSRSGPIPTDDPLQKICVLFSTHTGRGARLYGGPIGDL
jgi:hypothetical protein